MRPGARSMQTGPYIYLVLLTAKSQKEEIAAGLEAGADDYVIKPFDPDELRARLKVGQRVVALERTLATKGTGSGDRAGRREEAEGTAADLHVLQEGAGRQGLLAPDRGIPAFGDRRRMCSHGICPSCMEKMHAELSEV